MNILEVSGLSIRIATENGPVDPVVDVSFAVEAGEVLALVGGSGSGKSLTATAVLGLLPEVAVVSGGTIRFRGEEVAHLPDEARRALRGRGMAMVFQDPMQYLNPVMTCGDQVSEALRVLDALPSGEASARVRELFHEVGLPDPPRHARQFPHELSGGMRQRVLIAMMLAREPALLIADEPTTALDATVQAQILTLLRALARKRDMALLLITHDLNAVARTADRAVVMQAGRIVETLAVADLFAARHPYTRMLVAAMPHRPGAAGAVATTTAAAGDASTSSSSDSHAAPPLLAARHIVVAYPGGVPPGNPWSKEFRSTYARARRSRSWASRGRERARWDAP